MRISESSSPAVPKLPGYDCGIPDSPSAFLLTPSGSGDILRPVLEDRGQWHAESGRPPTTRRIETGYLARDVKGGA